MRPVEAPPVHLVLRAHPPAPARVGLVRLPGGPRAVKAVLSLAVFWGICPWVVWIPPHYPWPLLSFCLGAWLAHRYATGKYVVRWFAGECPRCREPLRIAPGARLDLPYTLTCFGCHFEPTLETFDAAAEEEIAADARGVRHVLADCAGSWRDERRWDREYLTCPACGARHLATEPLRAAARDENERGRLMEELAAQGRFLT